jgi:hypothetical protein
MLTLLAPSSGRRALRRRIQAVSRTLPHSAGAALTPG